MFIDNIYDFFKKMNFRRFLPVLVCSLLFFAFSPVQAFAADSDFYNTIPWSGVPMNAVIGSGTYGPKSDTNGIYYFSNPSVELNRLFFNANEFGFSFQPLFDSYDYYLIFSVSSQVDTVSEFTYFPTSAGVRVTNHDGSRTEIPLENFGCVHNDFSTSEPYYGFTVYGKIPATLDNYNLFSIFTYADSSLKIPRNLILKAVIYQVPASSDSSADVQMIINAINNQTNSIINAGSQFGGTSSDILSGNDVLSGFINDYTEVEQSMYDKFTENQTAVSGNFSGWTWGSLSTAVDWTSDYLNRIYDNSGDFRTMFLYPILAGIALIFIGRQGLTAYVRSRREK